MGVSVYLSGSNVQIIVGNVSKNQIKVQKCYSLEIGEGLLLNGVIIAEDELKAELARIWKEYQLPKKGIRLIVDSTQLYTKILSLPKVADKKIRSMVKKEFSELENPENYVYDYRVMEVQGKKGMIHLIGLAANQHFVEVYRDLFKGIGVDLESMDTSINGIAKVIQRHPLMRKQYFIAVHLDGDSLLCCLMEEGHIRFFNRTRIFSEHGTRDFAAEVAQRVSNVQQFSASELKRTDMKQVCISGFKQEDYDETARALEGLDLEVTDPDGIEMIGTVDRQNLKEELVYAKQKNILGNYCYTIGNLLSEKNDINLLKWMGTKGKENKTSAWKYALPGGITLAACMAITVPLFISNQIKRSEIKEQKSYIESEENQSAYAEAKEMESQLQLVRGKIRETQLISEVNETYPLPGSKVEKSILDCAQDKVAIQIDAYDAETGTYEFTAMAAQVTEIHAFINRLEKSDVFADLEYSGYNYTEDAGKYDIQINGYLSEHAGM